MYFFQAVLLTLKMSQDLPYTSQTRIGDLVDLATTYTGTSFFFVVIVYIRRWKFENSLSTNGTALVGVGV